MMPITAIIDLITAITALSAATNSLKGYLGNGVSENRVSKIESSEATPYELWLNHRESLGMNQQESKEVVRVNKESEKERFLVTPMKQVA